MKVDVSASGAGAGAAAVPAGVSADVSVRRASFVLAFAILAALVALAGSVVAVIVNLIAACGLGSYCAGHYGQGVAVGAGCALAVAVLGVVVRAVAGATVDSVASSAEGHSRAAAARAIGNAMVFVGAPLHFIVQLYALFSNT